MNIVFKNVKRPMVTSFTVFGKLDVNKFKERKTIRVSPRFITKTRIATTIQFDDWRVGFNWNNDNFKLHKKEEYNMMHDKTSINYYFKWLKNQQYDEYLKYLKENLKLFITKQLKLNFDELIVEIEPIK